MIENDSKRIAIRKQAKKGVQFLHSLFGDFKITHTKEIDFFSVFQVRYCEDVVDIYLMNYAIPPVSCSGQPIVKIFVPTKEDYNFGKRIGLTLQDSSYYSPDSVILIKDYMDEDPIEEVIQISGD